MSFLTSAAKGLCCAAFGAATMYAGTIYRDGAMLATTHTDLARDFVYQTILEAVPELTAFENRLNDRGKKYLDENDATLCLPTDRQVCYVNADNETDMLLHILDTAQDICAGRFAPPSETCNKLDEYTLQVLENLSADEAEEGEQQPAHKNKNDSGTEEEFDRDKGRQPRTSRLHARHKPEYTLS